MVTLKDIAQEAGVSVQLVSVVVNGKAEKYRISQATRSRVEETVAKLGYDPGNNRGARQMVARKRGVRIAYDVIAICSINDIDPNDYETETTTFRVNPYDADILAGIDAAAYKYGLDVLSCRHRGDELPRLIKNGEVDGIIPMGCSVAILKKLAEMQIPLVQIVVPYEQSHLVAIANHQGMDDVVQHLVSLGHENIAYIGYLVDKNFQNPTEYIVSSQRFAGYRQAMQDCNLTPDYIDTSLDRQGLEVAGNAVESLWKKSDGGITAVVCYNDLVAMGTIRRLQKMGLSVPQDVSVTGFDDISRQSAFEPFITSVYYDRFKLGYRAVELLWQSRDSWLAGEKVELTHEVLPVEFIARQSTAPPRKKKENS